MTGSRTLPGQRALVIASLLAIAALLGGPVAWAALAQADGAIVASAVVRTSLPVETVAHSGGGMIEGIAVKDGDLVHQGQVLLTLDRTDARAAVATLAASYRSARVVEARLTAEQRGLADVQVSADLMHAAQQDAQLHKEIEGQRALFKSRRAETASAARQGELAQTWAVQKIAALQERLKSLRLEFAMLNADRAAQAELVERGVAAAHSERDSARAVLRLQDRMAELEGQIADTRAQSDLRAAALDLQDAQRAKDLAAQLQQVRARLAEIAPRLEAARQALSDARLRAHVAGQVQLSPQTAPGSVARPAQPLMLIVPRGAGKRLVANVPASAISGVQTGQDVVIQRRPPDGPTQSRRGVVGGIAALASSGQGDPMFEVSILADPSDPTALSGLRPGQPVTVFLRTGTRPVLDYLLEPFLAFFAHALRES